MDQIFLNQILKLHSDWIVTCGREGRQLRCEKQDLTGLHFSFRDVSQATFEDCLMEGAVFKCCKMREVTFKDCDLSQSQFLFSNLAQSTFEKSSLKGAFLDRSTFTYAKFINAAFDEYMSTEYSHFFQTKFEQTFVPKNSRELLTELLYRNTSHATHMELLGLILVYDSECWDFFASLKHPASEWALDTLSPYLSPNDKMKLQEKIQPYTFPT